MENNSFQIVEELLKEREVCAKLVVQRGDVFRLSSNAKDQRAGISGSQVHNGKHQKHRSQQDRNR